MAPPVVAPMPYAGATMSCGPPGGYSQSKDPNAAPLPLPASSPDPEPDPASPLEEEWPTELDDFYLEVRFGIHGWIAAVSSLF